MAKARASYACTACGAVSTKWSGQCSDCESWNTLEESAAAPPAGSAARPVGYAGQAQTISRLADVTYSEESRTPTGIGELDRVLGGGLVPGSVTLLGGDPGIGKSTLLIQTLAALSAQQPGLYVSGEESMQQIKLRAMRLSLAADDMNLLAETCVERIVATAQRHTPSTMVIDSIQTIYSDALQSAPAIFLSRHDEPVSGSVIMSVMEGTRPLLVELQALVEDSHLGNPRRLAVGVDGARLAMLLAVMHRHGGITLHDQDVYLNAVGGVRVAETAADLPMLLACLSSLRDRPAPRDLIAFGEIGLAGEVRPVPNGQDRLRTAAKHGFKRAIVPSRNVPKPAPSGIDVVGVGRLSEAIDHFV